jgi:hypothetical protein
LYFFSKKITGKCTTHKKNTLHLQSEISCKIILMKNRKPMVLTGNSIRKSGCQSPISGENNSAVNNISLFIIFIMCKYLHFSKIILTHTHRVVSSRRHYKTYFGKINLISIVELGYTAKRSVRTMRCCAATFFRPDERRRATGNITSILT